MRQHNKSRRTGHASSGIVMTAVAVVGLAVGLIGCNNLLTVDNPGNVPAASLNSASMAPTLVASALGEFECALPQYILTAGVLSGEYDVSNVFVNANQWGWRGVEVNTQPGGCETSRTGTGLGFFAPLQEARYLSERGIAIISAFSDADVSGRTTMLAQLSAYAGYAYVLLGEGMCTLTFDNGPEVTRADAWKLAEQHFKDALTYAATANNTDITNMAHVGLARAELDLGDLADAATDAQAVPQGYVHTAQYSTSTPSRENTIYDMTIANDFLTVDSMYRGLTVQGQPDPRVPVKNMNRTGQDGVSPQWTQQKYVGTAAAPITIASWAEAQLIYAEAVGGQAAKDAINRVRAASGVPALDGSEGSDIKAIVLEERRRQLFSEGQRFGDMLRNNIPFPSGFNHKGQPYGPTTCVPLPLLETQNNPHLQH